MKLTESTTESPSGGTSTIPPPTKINRGDNPKDKSGLLDVKKGMDDSHLKCAALGLIELCVDKKIFAKWKKKQYCVLMWEDQQLRIYDNAQVS